MTNYDKNEHIYVRSPVLVSELLRVVCNSVSIDVKLKKRDKDYPLRVLTYNGLTVSEVRLPGTVDLYLNIRISRLLFFRFYGIEYYNQPTDGDKDLKVIWLEDTKLSKLDRHTLDTMFDVVDVIYTNIESNLIKIKKLNDLLEDSEYIINNGFNYLLSPKVRSVSSVATDICRSLDPALSISTVLPRELIKTSLKLDKQLDKYAKNLQKLQTMGVISPSCKII